MELGKIDKSHLSLFELLPGSQASLDFDKQIAENLKVLARKDPKSNLRIIFQGSNVAGEAQQKINEFIRK